MWKNEREPDRPTHLLYNDACETKSQQFYFCVTAIGGRPKPEIRFLPGQLRWTLLPKERYGDSLSCGWNTQPSTWAADTLPLSYRRPQVDNEIKAKFLGSLTVVAVAIRVLRFLLFHFLVRVLVTIVSVWRRWIAVCGVWLVVDAATWKKRLNLHGVSQSLECHQT